MGFNDANELLRTGGSPIVKFDRIGSSVTGKLLDAEVVDQTTPQGDPVVDTKTGRVKKQIIYTLQTAERDASIEDDDGKRRVFAKWAIQAAISDALRDMGLEKVGLQANGTLTITHTSTKPATTRGFSDIKLFEAKYVPPTLASSTEPAEEAAPATTSTGAGDGLLTKEQLAAKYGQASVDMAWQIYTAAKNTPLAVIAQASNIPAAELQFALTGEGGPF